MNLNDTIAANSDQIGAEDLLAGPMTVTITGVRKGSDDQPVDIDLSEFPDRAWRPCKTMRRVLVSCWGADASAYIGRRITIFNDPSVKWGGASVGGIRISALSHIDKPVTISLTESRGKKRPHRVEVLSDAPQTAAPKPTALGALFDKSGLPKDRADDRLAVTRKVIGRDVKTTAELTPGELGKLQAKLEEWDRAGDIADQVADILDIAAIEAEAIK